MRRNNSLLSSARVPVLDVRFRFSLKVIGPVVVIVTKPKSSRFFAIALQRTMARSITRGQGERRRVTSMQTLNFTRPGASRRSQSEEFSDKIPDMNRRHKSYLYTSVEFPVRAFVIQTASVFFKTKFVSGSPSHPVQITWDVHENGKSSGFVYLARVLFSVRISGANHVGRDAFLVVLRLPAVVVAHDRHVHLVQHLRR